MSPNRRDRRHRGVLHEIDEDLFDLLWIDPDRDLFVVLLTNRAYVPRARRPFTVLKEVRGRVADAAARAADAP